MSSPTTTLLYPQDEQIVAQPNLQDGVGSVMLGLTGGGTALVWNQDASLWFATRQPDGRFASTPVQLLPPADGHIDPIAAAALAGGGFVVAWTMRPADGPAAIHLQRFSASGQSTGDERVLQGDVGELRQPAAVATSDGGYDLVWQVMNADGSEATGLALQRFDAGGAPLQPSPVAVTNLPGSDQPVMTRLANGDLVVVWQVPQAYGIDLMARRFDASGQALDATPVPLQQGLPDDGGPAALAPTADGGYWLSWTGGVLNQGRDIFTQHFDRSGHADSPVTDATPWAGDQSNPALAILPDGSRVLAWATSQIGNVYLVQSQRWDASGPLGSPETLTDLPTGGPVTPSVSVLADGYGISWTSEGYNSIDLVSARQFTSTDAPRLAQPWADQHAQIGQPLALPLPTDWFHDADSPSLTYTVTLSDRSGTPLGSSWLSYNSASRALVAAQVPAGAAPVRVTVTASDGTHTASDSLVVDAVSELPVGLAPSSGAPAPVGVNLHSASVQSQPDIAGLSGGGSLVAWMAGNSSASGIYARHLDSSGQPVGPEIEVAPVATALDESPSVAAFADGGYVVAWGAPSFVRPDGSAGYTSSAYLRLYGAGDAAGPTLQLGETGLTVQERYPSVAALQGPNGGFVVSWQNTTPDMLQSLQIRTYNRDGSPRPGTDITLPSWGPQAADLVATPDGGYLVNYVARSGGGELLKFDAQGTQTFEHATGGTVANDLAVLADGDIVMVWAATQDGAGAIESQRYDKATASWGPVERVNTTLMHNETTPVVSALADGGYAVAWSGLLHDGSGGWSLYAQRFDAQDVGIGGEMAVSVPDATNTVWPAITSLAGGGLALSWSTDPRGAPGNGLAVLARSYSLTGNAPPTGQPTAHLADGAEDTPYLVKAGDLLAGFSDPDGDALSVQHLVADHGQVVDNGNASFTVAPDPDYNGKVLLRYQVADVHGASLAAEQQFMLAPVNDAPRGSATASLAPGAEGTPYAIDTGDLLQGFSDVDGDPLSVANIAGTHGTVTEPAPGRWIFTPDSHYAGPVLLTYQVIDGQGGTLAAQQRLEIQPGIDNRAPIAVDDTAVTPPGVAIVVPVLANDSDADGDALSVVAVTQGAHGSVSIDPVTTVPRYVPQTGFAGLDDFHYTIADGFGGQADADVTVIVATMVGTPGSDYSLYGTKGTDVIAGLGGSDFLSGEAGDDILLGMDGDDWLVGGQGADVIDGGAGNDVIFVHSGDDISADVIDGGPGQDTLQLPPAGDTSINLAKFSMVNVEVLNMNDGRLRLTGPGKFDLSALHVLGVGTIYGDATDTTIIGSLQDANHLRGGPGNDMLIGGNGDDELHGDIGNDVIAGGAGNDLLYGGALLFAGDGGHDVFVFNTALNAKSNVDRVFDFEANAMDSIALAPDIFTAVFSHGTAALDASEFRASRNGNAMDADDFILFDTTSSTLYYDADGNGPGAKVPFAVLVGLTGTLDYTDFTTPPPL